MKTRNWARATVLLGGFGAALAACATQTEDGLPSDTGGATNTGGGALGAAGKTSSAGSTQGSAGSTPNAGSPSAASAGSGTSFLPPAGGASSMSSAGASTGPGSPGAGGLFNAAGGATAGATVGGCAVAAGTLAEASIDNLEDSDNVIQKLGSRIGYWYTYNDMSAGGMQLPAAPFTATAGGSPTSALYAAHTSGSGFTVYGAGMGLNFNSPATGTKPCPYNASAYSGIKFMAKGNVAIRAMVKTVATTGLSGGGTCASATMCDDHYALTPAPTLTATWTEYVITFASTTTFAQEPWGTQVPFDKATVLGMQFQVPMSLAFEFWIDDVTFF